jgi:hypothetical protein
MGLEALLKMHVQKSLCPPPDFPYFFVLDQFLAGNPRCSHYEILAYYPFGACNLLRQRFA